MEAEERKPLNLNERLALSLSRNRTTSYHTTEFRVRKVKLDGRRRLCKFSSATESANTVNILSPGSSPGENSDVGRGDSNWDVLDDLSSRLETLSVEKPNRSVLPAPHESEAEFKRPSSPHSSSSSEERWSEGIEKIKGKVVRPLVLEQGEGMYMKGAKGKALERLVVDDVSDEEDCVVLGNCD